MIEDTALVLKKRYENGEDIDVNEAKKLLGQSDLIKKLLTDPQQKLDSFTGIRSYEWRLLELSEIPFIFTIDKVEEWERLLVQKTLVSHGYSLTGNENGLLACHNAMITTILIKMEYKNKDAIDTGINWILNYQNVERGQECKWGGEDLFNKFGGCMKSTPCYYGVIKSMIALTNYKIKFGGNKTLNKKLDQGLEYILKHRVFHRLSSNIPIEPSIIENFYPYTYKSNIIEILSLLKANNLLENERCNEAKKILKDKQCSDGFWQAKTSFMKNAWIEFDELNKPGHWISYIISRLIAN